MNRVCVDVAKVRREGGREVPLPEGLAGCVETRLFSLKVLEAGEGGKEGGRTIGEEGRGEKNKGGESEGNGTE